MAQPKLIRPNGPEVQRRRLEHGWSVKQLADKVPPCGPSSIYHIEAGRPSRALTIYRIAKAFGCPVEEISVPDEDADESTDAEAAA